MQAWLPIVISPQVEQPRVHKGNITTACLDAGLIITCLVVLFMSKRDERRAKTLQLASDPSVDLDLEEGIDAKVKISDDT
ncbi:hypothetical protein BDY19DRAFT_932372 [Irpex rosettiformis]|uniref:Uncharacterized protein n=1 Tax=Irpex rosettiformis TaxID=378272 RepID=A0ACB8U9R7_9APHY|nr:hypothetical protein BDY19DRAFT_932372 [Irpex rosettiformis]